MSPLKIKQKPVKPDPNQLVLIKATPFNFATLKLLCDYFSDRGVLLEDVNIVYYGEAVRCEGLRHKTEQEQDWELRYYEWQMGEYNKWREKNKEELKEYVHQKTVETLTKLHSEQKELEQKYESVLQQIEELGKTE